MNSFVIIYSHTCTRTHGGGVTEEHGDRSRGEEEQGDCVYTIQECQYLQLISIKSEANYYYLEMNHIL